MLKDSIRKIIAVLLIIILGMASLSACGSSESADSTVTDTTSTSAVSNASAATELSMTTESSVAPDTSDDNLEDNDSLLEESVPEESVIEGDPALAGLSDEQKASMAMMNYLAYVVQSVNDSRHSRVALEGAFDSLVNDVELSAVDENTRKALQDILDTIKIYRMNENEYERLAFLNDQENAQFVLSIIPNPLEVLDQVTSKGALPALAGVAFSTIGNVAESSYVSIEEMAYLERQWDLTDTEEKTLMDSRTNLLDYMIKIAQGLPKGITLREDDIKEFVTQTTQMKGVSKLNWLEQNQERYQYFGYYWLELADSYYENGNYEATLASVETYRMNDRGIFKNDKRLAETMKRAILAADECLSGIEYEKAVSDYIDTIAANLGTKDWGLRYYAAIAYMDLYNRTNNTDYLQKAYNEAKTNVRNLVPEQKKQNTLYLESIVEAKVKDESDKDESSIVSAYNKYIKNNREKELPPIYEPLLRNCELLFTIAEKLNISEGEKNIIDSMLHDDPVFLNYEIDKAFSYNKTSAILNSDASKSSISFNGIITDTKFTFPVVLASEGSVVSAIVVNDGKEIIIDDWTIAEVNRNNSKDVGDFEAVYTSKAAKSIKFKEGDTVTFKITPPGAFEEENTVSIKFEVTKSNVLGVTFTPDTTD